MSDLFKNVFWYILRRICTASLHNLLQYIPGLQKICNEAVARNPLNLRFVHDHFKTPGMCSKAVSMNPWPLKYIPDHLKTQEMFEIYSRDPKNM